MISLLRLISSSRAVGSRPSKVCAEVEGETPLLPSMPGAGRVPLMVLGAEPGDGVDGRAFVPLEVAGLAGLARPVVVLLEPLVPEPLDVPLELPVWAIA